MSESQYDSFSADFSATRQHAWPEFEKLDNFFQKGDRILDLGCGNGRLREFIGIKNIPPGNYFGFDLSNSLLNIARKRNPQDHFFQGNFAKPLPFGKDNFEIIVSIAAFHHLLNSKDQKACLKELHRTLKPGGKIFLTTWRIPQKFWWSNLRRWEFWASNWQNFLVPFGTEKHPRYYRLVSGSVLKKLLKNAGFLNISTELFRGKNWIVTAEKAK